MRETWREKLGYADMTEEEKTLYEASEDAYTAETVEKEEADKTGAGYADMTTEEKTVYKAEMLKWQKAMIELCDGEEGEASIKCEKVWAFREAETASRKLDGYYSKTADERETWDAA